MCIFADSEGVLMLVQFKQRQRATNPKTSVDTLLQFFKKDVRVTIARSLHQLDSLDKKRIQAWKKPMTKPTSFSRADDIAFYSSFAH